MSWYPTGTVELPREDWRSFRRPDVPEAERNNMRAIDVLGFGMDAFPDKELGKRGVWLSGVTALRHSDIFLAGTGYHNRTAEQIAKDATPADYDIVIVDNCVHTASGYISYLGKEMIDRTLVLRPGYDGSMNVEDFQARYGITNFGAGYRGEIADIIVGMVEKLPSTPRPDRSDIRIYTRWPGGGIEPGFEPASRQYDIG